MSKRDPSPQPPGAAVAGAGQTAEKKGDPSEIPTVLDDPALLLVALARWPSMPRSAAVMFCGDGGEVVALAAAWAGLNVVGFDPSERAIAAARRRASAARVEARVVFARADPLIATYGPYDLLVLRYPISGFGDGPGALLAATRALGPLGHCAVIEQGSLERRLCQLAARFGLSFRGHARNPQPGSVVLVFSVE
jgi:SAM-dependent methyltransferase